MVGQEPPQPIQVPAFRFGRRTPVGLLSGNEAVGQFLDGECALRAGFNLAAEPGVPDVLQGDRFPLKPEGEAVIPGERFVAIGA
jgi:hypothetical protein